ncbi:hypothetical protein ACIBHX_28950 [Nonomuraea sp. NPDC050536]|uniref:hypothetical protein n=1 Tax=Nonomuraea sp. NPDC050536 TaxID=3364366 RepID=UPI0037C9DC2A
MSRTLCKHGSPGDAPAGASYVFYEPTGRLDELAAKVSGRLTAGGFQVTEIRDGNLLCLKGAP